MYRILVIGANGQLGSEIKHASRAHSDKLFFFTDSKELDITDRAGIKNFIVTNKINAILNCAAYTAVDKAEDEVSLCEEINHQAVRYLGELAKEYDCKLVHISTDYVFDGNSFCPYVETDMVNPISVYGNTKLSGENALLDLNLANSIVIRTSWVYSNYGNNFVKTMRSLAESREELNVIYDQIGTPTNAEDLAKVILEILPKIENTQTEVYHYSNEGVCSWYDFAKAIFELSGMHIQVNPIKGEFYPTKATRPFYSVMSKEKIKEKFSIEIPYWRDSLKRCISKL